jgi:thioredoxin reductase (NADPH)
MIPAGVRWRGRAHAAELHSPAMLTTQVAIVGAGPIGLELAAALKKAGVPYVHFDAAQIGHTMTWYPRQVRFFSSPERIAIAGVPLQTVDQAKASREEYLAYLRAVVEQFDLQVRTFERVTSIQRDEHGFVLRTQANDGAHGYRTQYVVLAVGDMAAPRRLNIPGEDLPHVSHYFDEPHRYFRQQVLIVGGKNSAVEAALRCYRAGAKVSLSYRRERLDPKAIKYWLLPEIESLIRLGKIGFHPSTAPLRITPTHVTLAPVGDDPQPQPTGFPYMQGLQEVPAQFVLLLVGYVADTTLFELAGVRLEGESRAPAHNPDTMETNVPGLFVAGTAAGGTQTRFRLFIENCHVHVQRIVQAITGSAPAPGTVNDVKAAAPEM